MDDRDDRDLELTVTSAHLETPAAMVSNGGGRGDDSETRVFSDLFCPVCGGHFPGGLSVCTEDGVPLLPVGGGDDLSGTVLNNKYVLVQLIGKGGFGNVYRATHKLAKTEIAIKVIKDDLRDNEKAVKQFLKETRALMSIQSMHVVTVHDVDRDSEGRIYIVMELLRGRDLEDLVKAEYSSTNRMPWADVARIVLQVCDALETAHEKGIVHRDLKPGNVMMVQGRGGAMKAKVVDFGIASLAQTGDMDLTTMDAVPRVIGTPSFMSPEQAKGQPVDSRADLYSLGAMMYRLVCGCKPFDSKTDQGMLIAHVIEKPRPIRERCPELDVPPEFDALVMQLMGKTPDERPASAVEVASRIEKMLPVTGRKSDGGGHAWKIAVAVAAVVALVAGAGLAYWFTRSDSAPVVTAPDVTAPGAAVAGQPAVAPVAPQAVAPSAPAPVVAPATAPVAAPATAPASATVVRVGNVPAASPATAPRPTVAPSPGNAPAPAPVAPATPASASGARPAPAPTGTPAYVPTAPAVVPSVTTNSGSGFQAPSVSGGGGTPAGQPGTKASPMKAAIPSSRPGSPAAQPGSPSAAPSAPAVSSPAAGGAAPASRPTAVPEPAKPREIPKQIESVDVSKDDLDEFDEMDGRSKKKKKEKTEERRKADDRGDEAFDELNF